MPEFPSAAFVPDPSLPEVFVECAADTTIDLPHVMWNPEWRAALDAFAAAVPQMGPYLGLNYAAPRPEDAPDGANPSDLLLPHTGGSLNRTMHVRPEQIPDVGLRREMLAFAQALYQYEIPGPLEGVVITRSMVGDPGSYAFKHLFGFLRAGIVDLAGQRLAAHVVETHNTGHTSYFPPHIDLWVTALLLNLFNVQPPGQGISTMVPIDIGWEVIANSGMPDVALAEMQEMLDDRGTCDLFDRFNSWIYDDHPWTERLTEELLAASDHWEMQPGQGYLVNDRVWLHGRTALEWGPGFSEEDKLNRLYRLGYNNHRLQLLAERRQTDWAAIGYYANACVGHAVHYDALPEVAAPAR